MRSGRLSCRAVLHQAAYSMWICPPYGTTVKPPEASGTVNRDPRAHVALRVRPRPFRPESLKEGFTAKFSAFISSIIIIISQRHPRNERCAASSTWECSAFKRGYYRTWALFIMVSVHVSCIKIPVWSDLTGESSICLKNSM